MFYLIEEQNSEAFEVGKDRSLNQLITKALDRAELVKFVPDHVSRNVLAARLNVHRSYKHGNMTVRIVERA